MGFFTGQRVQFSHIQLEQGVGSGVILQCVGKDAYGICVDQPLPGLNFLSNLVGEGFGTVIPSRDIAPFSPEIQWLTSYWYKAVAPTLGVHLPNGGKVNLVSFAPLDVGRIVGFVKESNGLPSVHVSWMNKRSQYFSRQALAYHGELVENCYPVPISMLNLCAVEPETWTIRHSFGKLGPRIAGLKKGEILVYTGNRSLRRNVERETLSSGTIVRVSMDDGQDYFSGTLLGGCIPEMVGSDVRVDRRLVAPFEHKWISQGETVTVTAEVNFRKKPLQGAQGYVLLATDIDGDVGVEFSEDIGAGSLDGEGKDGHCLYLPASVLKISE